MKCDMKCDKYNKCNICNMVKVISIFTLIFLVIAIIIFISMNNPNVQKDILVAVARPGDNTSEGNVIINFSENQIEEGTALTHTPGTSQININEDGIYQISYSLTGVDQAVDGRFNFNAILLVNNVPQTDTLNEGAVLSEEIVNNRYTLTATVILRLNAGDVLQLGGLSLEDVEYENARIDIEKIG